jgi:hypothetical protein
LPFAASDFSCDITEKSRVNDVAEIDVVPPEPELAGELPEADGALLLLLLEQAARARPVVMASVDVQLILVNMFKQITSRVRRGQRGRYLAPFAHAVAAPLGSGQDFRVPGINALLTSPWRRKNSVNRAGFRYVIEINRWRSGNPPAAE